MISLNDFTSFDVIVALIFLFFLIRGIWIGFVRQLAAFLALVGSYLIAGRYTSQAMPYVDDFIANPKTVFYVSFVLLFLVGAMVFILLGKLMRKLMEVTLLGWFDRLLGLLLGALKGLVVASLLFMILASTLSASNDLLKKSLSAPFLEQGALLLQQAINDPTLRRLFTPKEPAIKEEKTPPLSPEKDKGKKEEKPSTTAFPVVQSVQALG